MYESKAIPDYSIRMTKEEFEKSRRMKCDDIPFSDMLAKYADLEDVSEKIEALFV